MALIPPLFVQSNSAFGGGSSSNFVQNLVFSSNVTQGDLLYVYVYGDNPTINSGSPTGGTLSLTSITDSRTNTWNSTGISSQTFSTGVGVNQFADQYFVGVFFAYANSSGSCTVTASWAASGVFTKTTRLNIAEWKNVGAFDRFGSGFSTSNPAAIPSPAVSIENNEIYIAATGFGITGPTFTPGIFGGAPWNQRLSAGSPGVGPIFDANEGPTGGDPTPNLTAGNTNAANYWASVAVFKTATATDPTNGNVFLSQYPGMPWMKERSISDPPVLGPRSLRAVRWTNLSSPNTGGARSGQTYPY